MLLRRGDVNSSVRILGKALVVARQQNFTSLEADIYGLLSESYEHAGRYEKAMTFATQQVMTKI